MTIDVKIDEIEKIAIFFFKNAKIRDVKTLKPFYYHKKLCSNPL